jgi:hypothetical protein
MHRISVDFGSRDAQQTTSGPEVGLVLRHAGGAAHRARGMTAVRTLAATLACIVRQRTVDPTDTMDDRSSGPVEALDENLMARTRRGYVID